MPPVMLCMSVQWLALSIILENFRFHFEMY